jgi:hypothetical protein
MSNDYQRRYLPLKIYYVQKQWDLYPLLTSSEKTEIVNNRIE